MLKKMLESPAEVCSQGFGRYQEGNPCSCLWEDFPSIYSWISGKGDTFQYSCICRKCWNRWKRNGCSLYRYWKTRDRHIKTWESWKDGNSSKIEGRKADEPEKKSWYAKTEKNAKLWISNRTLKLITSLRSSADNPEFWRIPPHKRFCLATTVSGSSRLKRKERF